MLGRRAIIVAILLTLPLASAGCSSKKDDTSKAKPPAKTPQARAFPRLYRDKITHVVVSWGKHTIAIQRAKPHWRVTTPYKDRVDPGMVEAVLRELERLEIGHQPVSTTPDAWPKYKLTTAEVVTLYITHAGKKLPALHIGDKKYARIGDSPDVYTRFNMNPHTWSRPPAQWRDRKLLRFDAEAATALEAIDGKGRRLLAKRTAAPPPATKKSSRAPDTWTLSEGHKIVKKLNPTMPNLIFSRLRVLRAADLAKVDLAGAGLDKPRLTLVVHVGKSTHALQLGKADKTHVYAKVRGGKRIWRVRAVDLKFVDRDLAAWGKPL